MRKAVSIRPDAAVDARRRHGTGADREASRRASGERVGDVNRARESVGAADPQVAAAVDRERAVIGQGRGAEIGRQPLDDAAAVEAHAGRSGDGPPDGID